MQKVMSRARSVGNEIKSSTWLLDKHIVASSVIVGRLRLCWVIETVLGD